jgi:hypothetical protein
MMTPDEISGNSDSKPWLVRDRLMEIHSPWVTVIRECLEDDRGQLLDYWRVEKADSAVIITHQGDRLLLPPPSYRPGVGTLTLDFPGGRIPGDRPPIQVVPEILQRELGIPVTAIAQIIPLNPSGWAINSAFSNQKLYGFVATVNPEWEIPGDRLGATYPTTTLGIRSLLYQLTCLQCRALLLEWHSFMNTNEGSPRP